MRWAQQELPLVRRVLREVRASITHDGEELRALAESWGINLDRELTPQEVRAAARNPHRSPRRHREG